MDSRLAQWLGIRLVAAMGAHDKAGTIRRKLGALFLAYFPGQISCQEFESFVYEYYERQLPEDQRKRFEFHMRICPMCESAFNVYVRTIELTGRVFDSQDELIPDEVPQELVNAMLAARRGKSTL